jgi:hypothetical protein
MKENSLGNNILPLSARPSVSQDGSYILQYHGRLPAQLLAGEDVSWWVEEVPGPKLLAKDPAFNHPLGNLL